MLTLFRTPIYDNFMDNNPSSSAPSINPQSIKEDFINNLSKSRFAPFKKISLLLLIFITLLIGAYFIFSRFKQVVPSQPSGIAKNFQLAESSPEDKDSNFSATGQPCKSESSPVRCFHLEAGNTAR